MAKELSGLKIGEARRFWTRFYDRREILCECRKQLPLCPFWSNVNENLPDDLRLQEIHSYINENSKFFKGLYNNLVKNKTKLKYIQQSFYGSIFKNSNRNVIIDSSKVPFWGLALKNINLNNNIIYIHLIRDLEDCANSWRKDLLLPEFVTEKEKMPKRSVFNTIKTWTKINLISALFVRKNKITIDYKDFCKNPSDLLNKLENYVDLNSKDGNISHGIGGNPAKSQFHISDKIEYRKSNLTNLSKIEVQLCKIWGRIIKYLIINVL